MTLSTLGQPSEALPDFAPDAHLRVLVAEQAIADTVMTALVRALEKLFAQFVREDRCQKFSCSATGANQILLLAWSPGHPLSGCSHDKINQVVSLHERLHPGLNLLAPAPILLESGDGFIAMTRSQLRTRLSAGTATATSRIIDASVTTVGAWRERGLIALVNHPLGRLIGLNAG